MFEKKLDGIKDFFARATMMLRIYWKAYFELGQRLAGYRGEDEIAAKKAKKVKK